jgi:hypothetical protein
MDDDQYDKKLQKSCTNRLQWYQKFLGAVTLGPRMEPYILHSQTTSLLDYPHSLNINFTHSSVFLLTVYVSIHFSILPCIAIQLFLQKPIISISNLQPEETLYV